MNRLLFLGLFERLSQSRKAKANRKAIRKTIRCWRGQKTVCHYFC